MINIDNTQLKEMFRGGYQNLMLNKDYVDQLNVFPVPDGDTGTNMGLTMTATIKEMDLVDGKTVKETAQSFAKGALKGARGNSGVILSQIFRGMSEILSDVSSINTKIFAKALLSGSNKAYDAVTQPKEGTILTVIRVVGEFAVKTAGRTSNFIEFFTKILQKGEETLKDTPRLLPVLAKAGVVDSGGQGLMFILTGMYNILAGIEMKPFFEEEKEKTVDFELDEHDLENIQYAYCTEFFIINLKPITTMADIDRLRDNLSNIGDCVLVVGDLQMVKVHVHTNTPDKALGYALAIGELNLPKIENMLEQNRQLQANKKKERKETGLLAISSGEGFRNIFLELGADKVLEGGQTMNPSVDDIVKYITDINANNVFVLPNNKNIILACELAQKLVEFNLVVIATY
ncbi:DAK2 domain-containing protein, partial [bacterium]|nr:DAK2 domain-containing protein [bacterium]